MYTAKVLLFAAAALGIAACESTPETPQKRYESLIEVATSHKPECKKYDSSSALGRDDTGSPECVKKQTEWLNRKRAAAVELEYVQLLAVPACTREWHPSQTTMIRMGFAPNDPTALAQMLRAGYVAGPNLHTPCAAQVCSWLRQAGGDSGYCY